ncbi:MAG: tetraacyldisaccharide 4'-kinase [Chlorobi bacterium]|nr:tetraacyldisaccharide 4'-kinase [Chlorobiota bacterium]
MKLLLIPLSYLFRLIVFIRNILYNKELLNIKELSAKVISVGNIAAGGTGKTPLVELIADYILERGKFVVIILRGYKREHDDIKVVELGFDNAKGELNSENFGDEGIILFENLSKKNAKGLIIVGDDKTKTAKFSNSKFKPEIIIIDDGFQHRKLYRDIDIVIINPHSDKHLLPAGNLREPLRNISRADFIVINNKFEKNPPMINTKHKQKIICSYNFERFYNAKGESLAQEQAETVAFCGVGEPDSFKTLLSELGIKVNDFIKFPDHHSFGIGDIERIIDSFEKTKSKFILTTQKDFVRIKNSELVLKASGDNVYKRLLFNYPLYYAKIKMQIEKNSELLFNEIDNLLRFV